MAQQQNPVNEPTQKGVGSHSSFRPNYSMYQTMRFGEYTPSFAMEVVPKDNITLRATKDVDTYTLKAPLMTAVRHLSTFQYVPMRALLPNTAELIITNPLVGDDVVAEDCNCGIRYSLLRTYLKRLVDEVSSLSVQSMFKAYINVFLHHFQLLMNLCSNGSVLANLGINLHDSLSIVDDIVPLDIDRLFEEFINVFWTAVDDYYSVNATGYPITLRTLSANGTSDTVYFLCSTRSSVLGDRVLDKRIFCEMLRDGYFFVATTDLDSFTFPGFTMSLRGSSNPDDFDDFLNLSRVAAYQICCADFFSNDKVDAVYSAQLYRQNMQSLLPTPLQTFKYNGIDILYDALSAINISSMLGSAINEDIKAWYYMSNLLCFQRSLRFGDYFAGAKVSPLAVGDVNIGVDSDSMTVDVIDVTRNIQRQRFLNQVNRVGRKFKDYIKGIFGDVPMPDAHEPQWIGDFSNIIGAEESVNSAFQYDQPNNMRSNLRSNTNKYAFSVQVSEPGVVIGIDYFDVPRAYDCGIDRTCLAADRYEMFNPFMQFVGDQEVKGIEIDTAQHTPFGYQLRYAEYKERVDRCAGGFIDFLPGYAIMLDHKELSGAFDPSIPLEISSDFIRAHAYEFDKLYVSLTNYSLAGYFHFIVRSDFSVDAKRPMSFAPSIL